MYHVETITLALLQRDGQLLLKTEEKFARIRGDEWSLSSACDEKGRGIWASAHSVVQSS
jgi:hypothetical protein